MDIESKQLRHLAAIGQHKTFMRAAKSLGISQPALSLSVQRLEDITKATLVQRGRNGAQLTEAGLLLARRSSEIDMTISTVLDELSLMSEGISGKLRVGGTPLSTNSIIPHVISKILRQSPDISIEMIEEVDEVLFDMLFSNQVDIVISASGYAMSHPDIKFAPLFSARTVIAMNPDNPLARLQSVSLAQLEDALWAMPSDGGTFRKQIEALFTTSGISFPRKMVQAASIIALMRVVRQTDAISLISEQLVRDELDQGILHCIDIDDHVAPRIFGIHTHSKRKLSNLGNVFCDLAKEASPRFRANADVLSDI